MIDGFPLAAACAAVAAVSLMVAISRAFRSAASGAIVNEARSRGALGLERARKYGQMIFSEGRVDRGLGERRALLMATVVAAFVGYSLLGPLGGLLAAILTPPAWRSILKARREQYARRVDAGCDEFAMALASSLSAGNSVRGALLTAGGAVTGPLAVEVEKLCVDLALGDSVTDAMAAIRDRTRSPRIEAMAGAIALHRDSGGDLVQLLRELAESFRARDRANRDARSATTQARYTAGIVAAIPLTMAVGCELLKPGSVSGAIAFLPTGIMLAVATVVMLLGVTASFRVGRA